MIKSKCLSGLTLSVAMMALAPTAYAQTATPPAAPASRMEIRMERDEFLKMHRYDDTNGEWMTNTPSTSDLSRSEVKAERDKYLRTNRWNEATDSFTPMSGAPRELSTLTREEVKMERMQFARTHTWDNVKSMWVMKPVRTTR
jgi:hypothetical protein